jgi:glycerophosphoryl diester phosphodiesterase
MFGKIVLISILLVSCSKKKEFDQIKVVGHAATGLEILNSVYHDNSKEAVEFALSIEGCDGVEIDIQLSKDGTLWLFHDDHLDKETNGSGCVNDLTDSQLSVIEYESIHKEKLTRLKDLNFTLFNGKELFLDLRHYTSCSADFVNVNQVIADLNLLNLQTITDFTVHCVLSYDQWISPFIAAGYKVDYSIYNLNEFNTYINLYPSISGFIVRNSDFKKNEIEMIKNANKDLFIFEIRSPKGIRSALNKNPDAVITDDIRATLIEKY